MKKFNEIFNQKLYNILIYIFLKIYGKNHTEFGKNLMKKYSTDIIFLIPNLLYHSSEKEYFQEYIYESYLYIWFKLSTDEYIKNAYIVEEVKEIIKTNMDNMPDYCFDVSINFNKSGFIMKFSSLHNSYQENYEILRLQDYFMSFEDWKMLRNKKDLINLIL